jgi:pyrroloquinoline quinone (PQQ) biosynthesis protein C
MSDERAIDELLKEVKKLANQHYTTAEVQYYLNTRLTRDRARCWAIHQVHFVRHRRDCWALAMGEAPLDVKRGIWLHEQDELMGDPRAGGADHFSLVTKEARLFGLTEDEIAGAELHPFVSTCFQAWVHLGRKSWLEALASTAVIEMVNSDAVIADGGHSSRVRQKLITELGISRDQLENRNVHVLADQEHVLLFDRIAPKHLATEQARTIALETVKRSLVIDRAFRAGMGFAMRQIPESS